MVATSYLLHRELLTKPWITMNKDSMTRNIVMALKDSNEAGNKLERSLQKMMNLVREHHEKLEIRDAP